MKNIFAEYLNLKIAPKKVLILAFVLFFIVSIHAQQDVSIGGSNNISQAIRTSLNSIPNLSVGNVTDNLVEYKVYERGANLYAIRIIGKLTIDYLDIEMPDGVIIRYSQKNGTGKFEATNSEILKPGYAWGKIGKAIWIDGFSSIDGVSGSFTTSVVNYTGNTAIGVENAGSIKLDRLIQSSDFAHVICEGMSDASLEFWKDEVEGVRQAYMSMKDHVNTINSATNDSNNDISQHNNSNNYNSSSTNQNNATNSSNNNNNTTTQQTTQIDEWGNPINTQTNTANYGGAEIQNNEHYQSQMSLRSANQNPREDWERNEAAKKQRVDDNNNNVMNEAYQLNLKTTNEINDMNNAFSELGNLAGTGNLSNPESLINAGLGIIRTANTMKGVRMGATLGGIGIAMGIIGQFSGDKKAEEEARRRQKEAEAKANAALEAMENARLSLFESFPPGELPLSFTKSKDDNLYYFVYAYNEDSLRDIETKISVSNVFALGRYPDGTWPMKNKVEDEVAALTTSREIICGPFYTINEANDVRTEFIVNLEKVYLKSEPIEYQGINAHSEDKINGTQNSNLDFWGNPLNEKTNLENPSSVPVDKQSNQKLDFFGNPIND